MKICFYKVVLYILTRGLTIAGLETWSRDHRDQDHHAETKTKAMTTTFETKTETKTTYTN